MRIVDLRPDDGAAIRQAAALLVVSFAEHWPAAWPDLDSALAEVRESFEPDRISRVAIDEAGHVRGWIGGIKQYGGHVWELHPLAVDPEWRRRGIGRALVTDLEERTRERGGLTLWLGSDDEANLTTLAGVGLFPNPLEHLSRIRNRGGHPYEFYLRLGFALIGVMPNANGPGKPDIYLAKSLIR